MKIEVDIFKLCGPQGRIAMHFPYGNRYHGKAYEETELTEDLEEEIKNDVRDYIKSGKVEGKPSNTIKTIEMDV